MVLQRPSEMFSLTVSRHGETTVSTNLLIFGCDGWDPLGITFRDPRPLDILHQGLGVRSPNRQYGRILRLSSWDEVYEFSLRVSILSCDT